LARTGWVAWHRLTEDSGVHKHTYRKTFDLVIRVHVTYSQLLANVKSVDAYLTELMTAGGLGYIIA